MTNTLSWPKGLPDPVLSSIGGGYDLGVSDSEMESGLLRQRRMYENLPSSYRGTLRLDRVGGARLMSFANAAAGASFDMEMKTPEDPFLSQKTVSARFISNPTFTPINGQYRLYSLDFFVESLEPEYLDSDEIWAAYDAYGGDLSKMMDLTEWAVNVATPIT